MCFLVHDLLYQNVAGNENRAPLSTHATSSRNASRNSFSSSRCSCPCSKDPRPLCAVTQSCPQARWPCHPHPALPPQPQPLLLPHHSRAEPSCLLDLGLFQRANTNPAPRPPHSAAPKQGPVQSPWVLSTQSCQEPCG